MAPALWLLTLLIPSVAGIVIVRLLDQKHTDHQRRTFRIDAPAELDFRDVVNAIEAVAGTLKSRPIFLAGAPTIAFELWATNEGIEHRIKIPFQHVDYVVPQLRKHGLRVSHAEAKDEVVWQEAVELALTNSAMPLRISDPADVSHRILASVQALAEGETVLVQWVVTPVPPRPLPVHGEARSNAPSARMLLSGNEAGKDEVKGRRQKLESANVVATLRVGAAAASKARAKHLTYNVRHALSSVRGPHMRFVKRWATRSQLQRRITQASGSLNFGIQLSSPELAALIAWPVDSPFIPGLAAAMTRHLPPPASIPTKGRVIGTANMPGAERPVAIKPDHAVRHMHVLGPNGTGKTTLLANMMAQDMDAGHGIILIEGKGDLFHAALDRVPKHRIDDTIILDVNDQVRPVGFNILDQGNSRTAIDELSSVIDTLYKDASRSILAPQALYHMLHALAEVPGSTFADLPQLLAVVPTDDPIAAWQDHIVRSVKSRDIAAYMQRHMNMSAKERDAVTRPLYNRIWEFTVRPEIKAMLGQRTSSFKMTEVVEQNKILLVNLNGIRVGKLTASIAGTLLVNAVWQAVRMVQASKENFLYLDEFQDFTNLPVGLEEMLAKARSAKLGTVLAHQHTGQLRPELRAAVLANTNTKIVFQTSSDDARLMAREFSKHLTDADFMNLPRFDAIARVSTDAGISPPVTISTHKPSRVTGNAERVRTLSRLRYGRPIEDVERDFEQRYALPSVKASNQPRPKPELSGGGEWFN